MAATLPCRPSNADLSLEQRVVPSQGAAYARSYMELRGELTGETGKDSMQSLQIQIVTAWSPRDAMPQIRFTKDDGEIIDIDGLFAEVAVRPE